MEGTRGPLRVIDGGVPPRKVLLPSAVLGMAFFIIAEAMMFSGFISAFLISRANFAEALWPPPGQPRLPVEATAVTTTMLLISGALVLYAGRRFREDPQAARRPMLAAVVLGALFVGIQGVEWARLIGEGLTLTSSSYCAFFYLIVGAHALHAVPAIIALIVMWRRLVAGTLTSEAFTAARMFWYFVVLVWPVLYWQVYL